MKVETGSIFQLKGGLYTLTALQLLESDLSLLERQLDIKLQQAPKFFQNAPIVIDLQKLKAQDFVDFKRLKELLLKKFLIPVGVRGGSLEHQSNAILTGLPILQDSKERSTQASEDIVEPSPEVLGTASKIITEPVRSGQQIYVRGGDLIILAPVSQGAEVLADGHIHIYGPLRGRALAGVTGDPRAHIFCQSLEAELISIAGNYKISEDIEQTAWQLPVNIHLKDNRLHIVPL